MRISDWSSDVCSSDLMALATQEIQPREDRIPAVLVQLRKGQVFELVLEAVHADALGQRRIDIHRLAGDPSALLRRSDEMQGLHVVQPVGQLHQQHTDILRHRHQQLAEILRSEEHTSELQSLMRISYAVFCLQTKKHKTQKTKH